MTGKLISVYYLFIPVILISQLMHCNRQNSPFQMESWRARTIEGTEIKFSEINSPLLILNFYSPTCQPCIEELPALEILYSKASEKGASMFIVLEGRPESHGLEDSGEDPYISIRNRMQEDIKRYNINIPVAVIYPEYPVFGEKGLITGTPETVILKTNPLVLKYNFVGPVASGRNLEEIMKDERLSYILSRLEEL